MLKVPGDAKSATEPAPEERFGQPEPTESDTLTTVEPQVKEVDFLALSSGEPLRVALLLPMTDGDKQNPNYLDFYQGFLLGLEKIKTQYGTPFGSICSIPGRKATDSVRLWTTPIFGRPA